jgi:hypothetical protein
MLNKHRVFSYLSILGRVLNGLSLIDKPALIQTRHLPVHVQSPALNLSPTMAGWLKRVLKLKMTLFLSLNSHFSLEGFTGIVNPRIKGVKHWTLGYPINSHVSR